MNRTMILILISLILMSLIISGCASVGKPTQFRYVGFHPNAVEGKDIVLIKDNSGKAYFILTKVIHNPVDLSSYRRLEEANVFSTQLNHIANVDDLPVAYHNYISAGFIDPETGEFLDFRKNGNWVIDLYESNDVIISQGRVYVRLSDDEKQPSFMRPLYCDSILVNISKPPYTVSSIAKFSEIKSRIVGLLVKQSLILNDNWFVVESQNTHQFIGLSIGYPDTVMTSMINCEFILFDMQNDIVAYRIEPDYGTPRKPLFYKDNIVFMEYPSGYFDNVGNYIGDNGRRLVFDAVRELQEALLVKDNKLQTSNITYQSCFFTKAKSYMYIKDSMQIMSLDNTSGAIFSYFMPIDNSIISRAIVNDSWNDVRFRGVVDPYIVFYDTECKGIILVNMENNEVYLINTRKLFPEACSFSCYISDQYLYLMCNYNNEDAEFLRIDLISKGLGHFGDD